MRCFSTGCSFFSTLLPESAGYLLGTFVRFFSRKKSKTATTPTNTAPAMKRIGELGAALIEGCTTGGVEPIEG